MGVADITLTAVWSLPAIPNAEETVEVAYSSVNFSENHVEPDKEYSFGLENGVMARFSGNDITGDVTFTAISWDGEFHVYGADVYSIDMVGSGSVNILIPVDKFGSPVVHHIDAEDNDVVLTSTIVEIGGVKYASFDADNFSLFYVVEDGSTEGGPAGTNTNIMVGVIAIAIAAILVAVWAYRRNAL
ncbi:hypothetical protein AOA81_04475 [Methanomassiliicoccales archaeon RumEn M2]|nr:hypothetical protein AOA81_04475 [Methanomassiliicoccales archaeon RumEn M2]